MRSDHRAARILSGRRSKFLILVFWVVALAAAGPLAGKLTDVEKNDNASWLPGGAESTRALEVQQSFRSPDALPAVVVYERPGGLTDADRTKAAADATRFAAFDGVQGRPVGPVPSADGTALETVVTFDLGSDGWQRASKVASRMRDIWTCSGPQRTTGS
jgi:RND superfamily putative drug exporter